MNILLGTAFSAGALGLTVVGGVVAVGAVLYVVKALGDRGCCGMSAS